MQLLIAGSIAYDDVKTPAGEREMALGGSGIYASISASYFTNPLLCSIAGSDLKKSDEEILLRKEICLEGVIRSKGETFHWRGEYAKDFGNVKTIETKLNVLLEFDPKLPEKYRLSEYIFLGNISPSVQKKILSQMKTKPFIAVDTIAYYINNNREELIDVINKANLIVINEEEARAITGLHHVAEAADALLKLGPDFAVIKRGEYGVYLASRESDFAIPAYTVKNVIDPTGAGDTFAGAMMGYLAGNRYNDFESIKKGLIIGSVMASFNIESFSIERLSNLNMEEIRNRLLDFKRLTTLKDNREDII